MNSGKRESPPSTETDTDEPKQKKIARKPFTHPGEFEDEIIMKFDDDKELYVSKILLCHISPVFMTMFKGNSVYVENKEKKIQMVGKKYDDVLELLFHLHPRFQKDINMTNVFQIVDLAEEYMIEGSIAKCKNGLIRIARSRKNADLEKTVDVLLIAKKYNYKDILEDARKKLSQATYPSVPTPPSWIASYAKIPDDEKLKILEDRCRYKDDGIVPKNPLV